MEQIAKRLYGLDVEGRKDIDTSWVNNVMVPKAAKVECMETAQWKDFMSYKYSEMFESELPRSRKPRYTESRWSWNDGELWKILIGTERVWLILDLRASMQICKDYMRVCTIVLVLCLLFSRQNAPSNG